MIILNNKSNLNYDEFLNYQEKLKEISSSQTLIFCPSNIYLAITDLPNFSLGAQNVSSYPNGAYTGEVSAAQLKSLNVNYCIVGHSERRNYLQEDDNQIKLKLQRLLEQDIIPILCIGEVSENEDKKMLDEQLSILKNLENNEKIIIAYEPVWAIGSGKTPSIEEIENVVRKIKLMYPNNLVIYGGSIDEENIKRLKTKVLDGYLIGGLSLNPEKLKLLLNELD